MTAHQVFHNVPIPARSGGRTTEGIYTKLRELQVDEMLFVADGTSRSTSATVSRVAKSYGLKFTSRKIAVAYDKKDNAVVVQSSTPGAVEGIGIWRVA
jgi:polysaccharide deacetylase 2 family uncharacterized protein YibQ